MMGQPQGSQPLHERDGADGKQYGATTATSPTPRSRSGRHGSITKSPRARYDSRSNHVDVHNANDDDDDDDDDAVLVLDGDGDYEGECKEKRILGRADEDDGAFRGDAVAIRNNNASAQDVTVVKGGDEERVRCGWCGFSPPFFQIFNSPKGYLFFACMLSLLQGMTAFGLVYVSITTLEHRFSLDSFQSSFIPSSYDFSALSVSIFITYLGERGHKPRWIGIGSAIFSLGSVIFALPHFLAGRYEVGETKDPLCRLPTENITALSECGATGDSSNPDLAVFYWVFIAAQILHGIGGSPLYTLGITYMDENLHASDFGLYLGIFNAINAAGPALGYILGGLYLKIYTDFAVTDSIPVSPSNPTWVGAWWLGFLVNGCLLFLLSLLMLGYPKTLPGSGKIASERKSEVQRGQEFESGRGWRKRLEAFPRAIFNLITNVPFMCLNMFTVAAWFFASGLSVFGPKYLESQLNLSSSDAGFYSGLLTMAGMVTGALVGGWVIKKLDLRFRGLVGFSMVCVAACLTASCGFLLECPNAPMAGVTVSYENSSQPITSGANITTECNKNCQCARGFDPVCGSNNVLYYSACYAGCSNQTSGVNATYMDCSCISDSPGSSPGIAQPGKCPIYCGLTRPFFLVLFLLLTFSGMVLVPVWTATIRCVPHSQRTFALGLQSLMYSALGTVPGPVVLGLLIDRSCLVWEESCDGSRTCWLYKNSELALVFFSVALLANVVSLVFLVGALFSYKTPDGKGNREGTYERLENRDETGIF